MGPHPHVSGFVNRIQTSILVYNYYLGTSYTRLGTFFYERNLDLQLYTSGVLEHKSTLLLFSEASEASGADSLMSPRLS